MKYKQTPGNNSFKMWTTLKLTKHMPKYSYDYGIIVSYKFVI